MKARTFLLPVSVVALFALSAVACGHASDATPSANTPTGDASSAASASAPSAGAATIAAPSSAPAADDQAQKSRRKPFEIHNACAEVVTLVFGEDAKAAGVTRRTLAANASSDGPRDDAGNQTVWLLDDKSEPLVKVHVTRGMKRVEVGRSCRSLDAR